jgi:hypothetical protein
VSRIYRSKRHNPDGSAIFGPIADTRLRVCHTAKDLAERAIALVPLGADSHTSGPGELIEAAGHAARVAEQLVTDTVVHLLAAGGTWMQAAAALKLEERETRQRYEDAWTAYQGEAAAERKPVDPGLLHNFPNLDNLDAWCLRHGTWDDEDEQQVTGALDWPEPGDLAGVVRTTAEAEQAAEQERLDAKDAAERAKFRIKYDAAMKKALAKLAANGGLGHTTLWADRRPPYVVVRDGKFLGSVRKSRFAEGVRWHVDGPGVRLAQMDERFLTLAAAVDYLDRVQAAAQSV